MIKRHTIKKPRHFLNHSEILTNHYEDLDYVFSELKAGGELNLYLLRGFLFSSMVSAIMSNQSKNLVYTVLKYYLDIGVSHFNQYFANQDEIKILIGKEEYKVGKINRVIGISCYSWVRLFSISLILRDEKRKNELLDLVDEVAKKNEFLSEWLEYFKFELKDAEPNNKRVQFKTKIGVFKELNRVREAIVKGRPESIERNQLSLIILYELISMNDQETFNELLNIHLENKKKFIIKTKKHNYPDLWIDFEVLACCSYAYDKNIKISIQSEYIPSWVYEEEWSKFTTLK